MSFETYAKRTYMHNFMLLLTDGTKNKVKCRNHILTHIN